MNESIISTRYSRALFQTALDRKILDKVNKDMIYISEVCKVKEAAEFLQNPVIVPSKKIEVFHKLLSENVEGITLSMIDLLVKNGRENYLPSIARVFISETLRYKGITKSVLTTAYKVDENIRKRMIALISDTFKTRVELQEVVDPEIIGGFILRVEDSYIDASVRNKLNKIMKELKGREKLSL